MLLRTAVRRSIRDLQESQPDKGACELALHYARIIDGGGDPKTFGPLLLACLESLLLTPRARAAVLKGVASAHGSALRRFRERQAARVGDPAPMDPAAS